MEIPFSILLLKVHHAQANFLRPLLTEVDLSAGQPKVLTYVHNHEGCMQKDLAAFYGIEPATISRLLDRMESDGLIVRKSADEDKRATAIYLTEKGRAGQDHVARIHCITEEQGLQGFSEEEKQVFRACLKRLYKNLTGEEALDE